MTIRKITRDYLDDLAIRMRSGDRRATTALYRELFPKVYGFFFSRTGKKEAAEDLTQEMFVKLIEKIHTFDENRGKFTVWFWQVARRHLIDHYRQKESVPFSAFEETEVETLAVLPELDFNARFAYADARRFVDTFPKNDRELFDLRFVAEVPYRDIAAMTGRQESTLRVAVMRIKEKVRDHLASYRNDRYPRLKHT